MALPRSRLGVDSSLIWGEAFRFAPVRNITPSSEGESDAVKVSPSDAAARHGDGDTFAFASPGTHAVPPSPETKPGDGHTPRRMIACASQLLPRALDLPRRLVWRNRIGLTREPGSPFSSAPELIPDPTDAGLRLSAKGISKR